MTDNFRKIRKKLIIESLLMSIFIGLFIGLMVSSILVLTYKQLGIEYNLILFIIIGVIVFVLLSIGLFFVLRPNEVKTARRIDKQLDLKQKVSTMVEYKEKDGYLINKQREDAKEKLDNIPTKKFKFKFSIYLIILPIIVLPLLISAAVVDFNGLPIEEEPDEKPISGDPYIIEQLRDLIREVNANTNLITSVKEAYVSHLETLIEAIDVPEITRSAEVSAANSCISNINNSANSLSSINDVIDALRNTNFTQAQNLGIAMATYDISQINTAVEGVGAYVRLTSPSRRQTNYDELVSDLFDAIEAERIGSEDEMQIVFDAYKASLATAIADNSNYTTLINEAIATMQADLETAIIRQRQTFTVSDYLEERLIYIFELPNVGGDDDPDIPQISNPTVDPDNGNNGGGGGYGEIIYAGDDLFYDPDEGLVPYHEVINKYEAYIAGLVADGVISEELANYYIEYFDKLYNTDGEE